MAKLKGMPAVRHGRDDLSRHRYRTFEAQLRSNEATAQIKSRTPTARGQPQ